MCLLKGNVQANYGDDAHRMKIQCESIYIHTAIEEKLQWHFWCQRSSGILNIDFLGTVGITKIELILGAGKKVSKCHACYFHGKRKKYILQTWNQSLRFWERENAMAVSRGKKWKHME